MVINKATMQKCLRFKPYNWTSNYSPVIFSHTCKNHIRTPDMLGGDALLLDDDKNTPLHCLSAETNIRSVIKFMDKFEVKILAS